MAFNLSNGRPVYQHRRSQSDGINEEGQPTTDQIEEGEIAINLTTRKLYTKRPSVTRDSDNTSDKLIGRKDAVSNQKSRNFSDPGVDYSSPVQSQINSSTQLRFAAPNVYGQEIENGAQIKIISRRLLDSDEAGNNIEFTLRQSYFLDSEYGLRKSVGDEADQPTSRTNNYDARHMPDSETFRSLTIAEKLESLLHDSDGTVAAGVTAVNASAGSVFGGGVKTYSISIAEDSDYQKEGIAKLIADAVNASVPSFDANIKAERDSDNPEIVYIYGGDKRLQIELSSKFVRYIDHAKTPLYKYYFTDSDSFNNERPLNKDSDAADLVNRVEITYKYKTETEPRVAAVANTIRTRTNGIIDAGDSLIHGYRSIVLKNQVGSLSFIDSDVNTLGSFKLRPADFTGTEEIVNLNAVAAISSTPPDFDLVSGALWVDNRSEKTPKYDAVDSETHTIQVRVKNVGGYSSTDHDDGSSPVVPDGLGSFKFLYGPRRTASGFTANDSDSDAGKFLTIQAGDSEGSIAFKIYRILRSDSDDGHASIKNIIMSNTTTLTGGGGTTIGTESNGVPSSATNASGTGLSGSSGVNVVKVTYDSEHDSDLFAFRIFIQGDSVTPGGDSDGQKPSAGFSGYSDSDDGTMNRKRHKYVGAFDDSDVRVSGGAAQHHGIEIEIRNTQNETGRVIGGKQPAELFWLDATLVDDETAQARALEFTSAERTEKNIVRFKKIAGTSFNDNDDRAYRYAEWRKVDAPSVLSPQALDLTIAGQTFTGSTELRILDSSGVVQLTGFLLT